MFRTFLPLFFCVTMASSLPGEDLFELPPIDYSQSQPDNRISKLQAALESDRASLNFEPRFGYLRSLLQMLEISEETQMLVFSKTSLQRHRIAPRTPRAIYFNDDTYVGYCHAGDLIEISVADPQLGAVFYTLEQTADTEPAFRRRTHNCLLCHGGSRTDGIPGHVIRSVFTDAAGFPILSEGGQRVDHATPLEKRWGGWYVTGTHGTQVHQGNFVVTNTDAPRPWKNNEGQNITDLEKRFPKRSYLTPHSDIVALMVFEHQTFVHNLLTKANYAARQALYHERSFNKALGEPEDNRLESTTRRIQNAGEKLLEGLLMFNEAPLSGPIAGTSDFSSQFMKIGPHDENGRSLRELDLTTRLFKYPCSYLIYSEAFNELPSEMKEYVQKRLVEILDGEGGEKYAYLSSEDLESIRAILKSTRPDLFEAAPAE